MAYTARYWTVTILGSLSGTNITLGELQFRTTAGVSSVPSGGTPIYSSQQNGTTLAAANLFDGSSATGWAAGGVTYARIGYDFGTPITAVELAMTSWTGDASHSPSSIIIESSTDGVTVRDHGRYFGVTWGAAGSTQTWTIDHTGPSESVSALAMHTASGGSGTAAVDVASLVQHTVAGASPSESWVSALAMHTVRGGRVAQAAVDLVVMHTVVGPGTRQHIKVRLVARPMAVA